LRLQEWNSKIKQKNEEEQKRANLESEIKSSKAVLENQKKDSTAKLTELQKLSTEIDKVISDREKLYGKKNPDEEEERLQNALMKAEECEKDIQLENRKLQENLVRLDQELKSLTQSIQVRQKELAKDEIDFLGKIQEVGFADEILFTQALLTKEEIESLKGKAKEIDDLSFELKIKQADKEKSLEEEKAKKITEKTKDELEAITKDYEQTLVELRKEQAELDYQLSEDKKAKESIKEKQKAIDAQQKEYQRWKKLHDVIGSADGKKYRNFAQGLTFELMVKHANRQLTKMSDRYLLTRDSNKPLELNVIDNYQAGEIRSTKNLSGGESFIVSLSLALGLSKMASKKVKVDSLFLDEGFGTLDEDALETALESLSGLQQDGKLIGIISHVTALKENIDTQISITPISGGRSSISGPGVLKINQKE
jgi:exonuclease SbcC